MAFAQESGDFSFLLFFLLKGKRRWTDFSAYVLSFSPLIPLESRRMSHGFSDSDVSLDGVNKRVLSWRKSTASTSELTALVP